MEAVGWVLVALFAAVLGLEAALFTIMAGW